MECHYHPGREGTDSCAICGKSICKECGLEIAGKVYCKECLEKIVGIGIQNSETQNSNTQNEPARLSKQENNDNIYNIQPDTNNIENPQEEIKQIRDDSPYNIKDNIQYTNEFESNFEKQPQIAQNEYDAPQTQITQKPTSQEYIYPDHDYEPQPVVGGLDLEDKYEKYLDDLYFDEKEMPLGEQLAKDEAQYGSLTRKEYPNRTEEVESQTRLKRTKLPNETPEEMEGKIRSGLMDGSENDKNIHKINYKDEKEPMSAIDIILTIILVIVILIVVYYLLFIFILNASYPTFMDAIYGLSNPQNVINNLLNH